MAAKSTSRQSIAGNPTTHRSPHGRNRCRHHSRQRRGVVLLIVISLLTLFILIGVTYAIVASNYLSAAKSTAIIDQVGDPPQVELDEVITRILADTVTASSLQGGSLLTDVYSFDGVYCELTAVVAPIRENAGQTLRFSITPSLNAPPPYTGNTLSTVPDYYNGRVVTFLRYNGNEIHPFSTRVMQYAPDGSGGGTLVVSADFATSSAMQQLPIQGDVVLINGAPFNGTGAGYQASAPYLGREVDVSGTNRPVALLPHYAGHPDPLVAINDASAGGFDESYDAPDYQNMYLALVPAGLAREVASGSRTLPLLPSYHRPELVNYWDNVIGPTADMTVAANQDLMRRVIFRPMPWDHPNFTGSNAAGFPNGDWAAALANAQNVQGIWDVDNDSDGVADSVWIDPGLPIITTKDGRKVKRLVAVLILDLDSRININVHGNLAQTFAANHRANSAITSSAFAGMLPSSPTGIILPRGLGYGPAEVDWQSVIFGNDPTGYNYVIQSRYQGNGENNPGVTGDEFLSQMHAIGMISNNLTGYSSYGSPPDVYGRGAVASDHYGQPAYGFLGDNETVDDPYEVQFDHRRATADRPYDVSDMEWLLRYHDSGVAAQQTRLQSTTETDAALGNSAPGVIAADHDRRQLLTTISSNMPVPPGPHLLDQRANGTWATSGGGPDVRNRTILDLYAKRLSGAADPALAWSQLVPFEFRHGQKFNLNRPFGNGLDDDGNGVIDDFSEGGIAAEQLFMATFEKYNDTTGPDPRQIYARHLYMLMMLLKDTGGAPWQPAEDLNGDGVINSLDTAHYFAQYAVNVVDFRDNDSIMTGFEYDTNPFDGWDVDGDLSTTGEANRGVVWGTERPELLITESLATHNLNTSDEEDEEPNGGETAALTTATTNPDVDFDQRFKPQGSFFLELFNPWFDFTNASNASQQAVHKTPELYDANGGVALNRVSAGGAGSPVWRILIIQGTPTQPNPDLPRPEHLTGDATGSGDIERSVYFVDPTSTGTPPGNHGVAYYPTDASKQSSVKPGRYAVVGSATRSDGADSFTTYFGQRTTPDEGDVAATRRIVLTRSNAVDTNQLNVFNYETAPNITYPNYGTNFGTGDIAPVVAIPIDGPKSLTISEPASGDYAIPGPGGSVYTPDDTSFPITGGSYVPPIDTPFDNARSDGRNDWDRITDHGTLENFRTLHLQRLANPLLPWNSQTNPYLTVDSASVDLTVFNGVSRDSHAASFDKNTINFQTWQRGGAFPEAPGFGSPNAGINRNIWLEEPSHGNPTATSPDEGGAEQHVFNKQLFHTLGFLNRRYHPYFNSASSPGVYLGAPDNSTSAPPWLAFLNRPLMSPYELMLVPTRPSSQLLGFARFNNGAVDVYDQNNYQEPYRYLMNFYQSTTSPNTVDGPMVHRLFDFVTIPSRFAQADHVWNPASFDSATHGGVTNGGATYRSPFAWMSRFQDPGRININTVSDTRVLEAMLKGMPQFDPSINIAFVDNLLRSRQGYGGAIGSTDVGSPSLFSNPFRAQDAADLVPLASMQSSVQAKSVNAGLLRQREGATTQPPLIENISLGEHSNVTRNPYFRYQGLQKMSNLVGTQSNCFAVWVTMGYFEAEPAAINAAHRDGYSLGQEVGIDSGSVQRHRGFYIIDRSVPVGFIPGKKLNTDDAILMKRLIE